MPDPINLRIARKAKTRAIKEKVAAQNRVSFGQSKSATTLSKAQAKLAQRRLDGARLEGETQDEPD
jgi:hypothetical protein